MRTPTIPSKAVDLAEVRAQFDAWRSTRAAGGHIPDHVWSLAIALLSSHPATEVARQLGAPSRAPAPPPRRVDAQGPHAFLELAPDALATHAHRTRGDLRLVIECPDGTRISLASATSDWAGLGNPNAI